MVCTIFEGVEFFSVTPCVNGRLAAPSSAPLGYPSGRIRGPPNIWLLPAPGGGVDCTETDTRDRSGSVTGYDGIAELEVCRYKNLELALVYRLWGWVFAKVAAVLYQIPNATTVWPFHRGMLFLEQWHSMCGIETIG